MVKRKDSEDIDSDSAEAEQESEQRQYKRISELSDTAKGWLEDNIDLINIHEIKPENNALVIDYELLKKTDAGKYILKEFISNYNLMSRAMNYAAYKVYREMNLGQASDSLADSVMVRFVNAEDYRVPLTGIGARHYNKFVTTRGKVVSISPKQPYALSFSYTCRNEECNHEGKVSTHEIGEILSKPLRCSECKKKEIDITDAKITSSQFVRLVDSKPTKNPTHLNVFLIGEDLCNKVSGGQVVDIFGLYNIDFRQDAFGVARGKPIYRLDANNIEPLQAEVKEFMLTPEDIKRFDRRNKDSIVNEPDFWDKSVHSFAPEIEGYRWIKQALMCLCVSLQKQESSIKRVFSMLRESSTLNIMLCGSQSTAKSHFLRYVVILIPNAQYVSLGNATAASLTVAAERDKETGIFTINLGVGPQCDGSVMALDEFDKARGDGVIGALHEIGSNKTCSYAVGSNSGTVPADCGWVFGCNSRFGQWNELATLADNLGFMPPSFITRFDATFVMLDTPKEDTDFIIASRVLENNEEEYWDKYLDDRENLFGFRTMKKYVQYVNAHVPMPKISKAMQKYIATHYSKNKRKITELRGLITPRYVKTVSRFAVTHARWLQKSEVDQDDIDFAINEVLERSLQQVAYDPITNELDGNLGFGATPKRTMTKMLNEREQFVEAFSMMVAKLGRKILTMPELKEALAAEPYLWPESHVKAFLNKNTKVAYETHNAGLDITGWQLL